MLKIHTNRLIAAGLMAGTLGIAGTAQAAPLSHWTFDSTVADSGSAGQNGTLVGTASYDTTNHKAGSGALLLDGAGAVDISQANAALHGLTTATLSAWVRVDSFSPSALGDVPNIFGRDLTTATRDDTNRVEIAVDFRGGLTNWRGFGLNSSGSATIDESISAPFSPPSGWVHVAVVFDASQSDQLKIYTNGVVDDDTNITGLTAADFDFAAIGGFTDSGTAPHGRNNLVGAIDDVQIYGEALSASDIATLFANPGSVVPEPGSLALLTLGGLLMARRRRA